MPQDKRDSAQCQLDHRIFQMLGEPLFIPGPDGLAMMSVTLSDKPASLPLRALQREAQIEDASPDGCMIGLIERALSFVQFLRIGDDLPKEVLTGEASWTAEAEHYEVAYAKLQYKLVRWLTSAEGGDLADFDMETLIACVSDPAFQPRVQSAFQKAAQALGLADGDAVLNLVERMAQEFAYVEALRVTLLQRVQALQKRLAGFQRGGRGDSRRRETLDQVNKMMSQALAKLQARFEDIDAQTGEVVAALRNADSQISFIRGNRDWLYATLRAWEDLLGRWAQCPPQLVEQNWALIGETYRFLAPRFMTFHEWKVAATPRPATEVRMMTW